MSIDRLLILSAAILLEIYQLHRRVNNRGKKMKLLHQILELVPLKPQQIVQKIKDNIGKTSLEICKGEVFAGEKCTAFINPNREIIFSRLIEERLRFRVSPKRELRVKQPSFLKIVDENTTIPVFETHAAMKIPTKQLRYQPRTISLRNIWQKIASLFYQKDENRLKPRVGLKQFGAQNLRELIIPDGAQCSILGSFTNEPSGITCSNPLYVAPSKQRIVSLLQEDLLSQKLIIALVIFGTGVTLIFFLKELWDLCRKFKLQTSLVKKLDKIFLKSRMCVYCKKNLSCMLSKSCMHMAVCQNCWQQEGQNCSECKKQIKEIVELFVC